MIHKVNDYFMNEKEIEAFSKRIRFVEDRIHVLENMMDEIRDNEEWMRLCGGKVWKWFYVELWRRILIDNRLSDEEKSSVMRMCVLEKVKYGNMGYKTMKRFIEQKVFELKKGGKVEDCVEKERVIEDVAVEVGDRKRVAA